MGIVQWAVLSVGKLRDLKLVRKDSSRDICLGQGQQQKHEDQINVFVCVICQPIIDICSLVGGFLCFISSGI